MRSALPEDIQLQQVRTESSPVEKVLFVAHTRYDEQHNFLFLLNQRNSIVLIPHSAPNEGGQGHEEFLLLIGIFSVRRGPGSYSSHDLLVEHANLAEAINHLDAELGVVEFAQAQDGERTPGLFKVHIQHGRKNHLADDVHDISHAILSCMCQVEHRLEAKFAHPILRHPDEACQSAYEQ
eukprot:CAMPEP_0204073076 /NCGR_PEP_ID=MMETSP0360-20130528/162696_1 /ASSEMBLY_ACC=CAM_ASM_000342 /TAXON_ID=268821 /ORGANISM="Scrippsiella Hangoei, Strain SHTV-5" /LENGTH=179 /DNA_ID=CAMNT_0051021447 /DNA_START=212 /DNA_END=751 /DNA_ORIENTATION=+